MRVRSTEPELLDLETPPPEEQERIAGYLAFVNRWLGGTAAVAAGRPGEYERERRRLASGSEWLGRWMLRATRYPAIADRAVSSLVEHPDLFTKLLEISAGARQEGELTLADMARLVV